MQDYKRHITFDEWNFQTTKKQKDRLDAFFRTRKAKDPSQPNGIDFWNIENMKLYIKTQIDFFKNPNKLSTSEFQSISPYNFDIDKTSKEELCDKLWQNVIAII